MSEADQTERAFLAGVAHQGGEEGAGGSQDQSVCRDVTSLTAEEQVRPTGLAILGQVPRVGVQPGHGPGQGFRLPGPAQPHRILPGHPSPQPGEASVTRNCEQMENFFFISL